MPIAEQNLPRWLIRALRTRFGIREFVETGTLFGHTAVLASEQIPVVHTIEISRSQYEQCCGEARRNPRITRHLGSSVEVIPQLLPGLAGPTLWYLDGHWSGQGPRLGPECPVVEEIRLIGNRPGDVVVVDDARLFISPPGPPHRPDEWPTLEMAVEALRAHRPESTIQLWFDSILSTPAPIWIPSL
jgi:hypothetical protein